MRKVAKIGLKGTDKEFCINYKDTKHGICVEIQKQNYIKEISSLKLVTSQKFTEIAKFWEF